ncbi:MAG: hypothetical protein BWY80_00847 [Firmicutes bacterium ADurb.Bin456]|nr:MAG: hypothetical protein BWY80_00847 [Firmicutes bacterium ADurb.Bin456]
MPPAITHVLSKVDRVTITLFKDGLGGGEPVYEIFTGTDEDEDPRTVTLSLADMTADTPGMFKRRWTAVFVADFLEMTRDDWISLRRSLVERAEVREVEHTGEGDALISGLLEELRYKTFTEIKDVWTADTNTFLLCEHTPDGWVVYVTAAAVHGFLKRQDLDPTGKTPSISKELRRRGITTGVSKTIRVEKGTQGTVRVWTFKGDALDFREDMLYERANTPDPHVVTGESHVTGENGHTLTQAGNGRNTEPGTGGV